MTNEIINSYPTEPHNGWNPGLGLFLTEVEFLEDLTYEDGDIPSYGDASIWFSFAGDPLKRKILGYAHWPDEYRKSMALAEVQENIWLDWRKQYIEETTEPTILHKTTEPNGYTAESVVRIVREPKDSPSRCYEVCVDGIDAVWILNYHGNQVFRAGTHVRIFGDHQIWWPADPITIERE